MTNWVLPMQQIVSSIIRDPSPCLLVATKIIAKSGKQRQAGKKPSSLPVAYSGNTPEAGRTEQVACGTRRRPLRTVHRTTGLGAYGARPCRVLAELARSTLLKKVRMENPGENEPRVSPEVEMPNVHRGVDVAMAWTSGPAAACEQATGARRLCQLADGVTYCAGRGVVVATARPDARRRLRSLRRGRSARGQTRR